MKTNIGLTDNQRKAVVQLLVPLLADEHVLSMRTRNYHWNVEGPHFNDLHALFESQYRVLDGNIDAIAERIRALGHKAAATLTEFLKATRLKENPAHVGAKEMVSFLLFDHETIIRALRNDVEAAAKQADAGTADFLTGLMEQHEKTAWMLRAISAE